MPELDADFEISNNNHLEAEYTLNEGQHFDCSFEIFASGTTWGAITGNIENQTDLIEVLETKADNSTVESLSDDVGTIQNTIDNYGTAVLYNATDFATAEQGAKADTALQPSALDDYATTSELNTGLATKQDTINDLDTIRGGASDGKSAYNTISNYGNIVTHNTSEFATSTQGALADSSLQPNDNITQLNNNAGYITSASLPTVNNATIKFQKNGTDLKTITLNQSSNETINFPIPTQASDINAVPTSRTVNNKSLANNVSLNASDVSALPSTTSINDLTTTAQQNALNSGATSTNISQITTNQNNISDIQDLIPTQASDTNQLADKSFVNSSISTNTANFIGTFQSVADLEAYSGTLTNNDYAFVETTDTAGNTLYDRYKYTTATTPASWQFEYELNNSSFTAIQWAAINSGANTTNIGQIATNTNDIQSINTTIGGYGNIVTHNASEFATSVQGGLADTSLQPNDNISELTNDSGYITGITSNDVTTALGYTPYDSSNPDGYTTNVGTVTDVKTDNISVVNSGVANIRVGELLEEGTGIDITPASLYTPMIEYEYATNSTGTYIDTGIISQVDDIEMEIRVKPSTDSWYIFQSRASANSNISGITGSSTGNTISGGFAGNIITSDIARDTSHIFTVNLKLKNGVSTLYVKDETTGMEDTKTGSYTFTILTRNFVLYGNSTINQRAKAGNQIYYAWIKIQDTLVMDYIPILNDTESGFYDRVSNTFKGVTAGELTVGGNVLANGKTKIAVDDSVVLSSDLSTVATTGSYNDLTDKPTIPAAQVNSDWNSSSGVSEILNKPTIPTVYNSTITFTQGGVTKGSFTLNQSSGDTIALDGGGGGSLTSILEAIYPVGSVYATTDYNSGVCPLESLFTSSWSLLSSTIVTDVGSGSSVSTSEAVAIQGNGKTAIMADDPATEGLGAIQIGYSTSSNYYLTLSNSDTSQNLIANSGNYSTNKHKLGFSKLATKTGLIGSVTIPSITITPSKTTQTVYLFQRTA